MRSRTWRAERLGKLPPYLFVEIDRAKQAAIEAGRDVIDFGVGDPDRPTPKFIVERMCDAVRDPANHRYPLGRGKRTFRRTVAAFFERRFGVTLDPEKEVGALLGSKEGIGHFATAMLNPGEVALVPDPGYPVYISGAVFSEAAYHRMPLRVERGFLPDLAAIPADVLRRAKVLWLNYPNNPTAACAPMSFFEEALAFARKHDLLIAQDAAYSETYYEDPPPSILQLPGAKERCIEFHSLSKTFNMTGWRIGFSAGNAEAVTALADVKNNLDSGVFGAVQDAAIAGLENMHHPEVRGILDTYRERRDALVSGLKEIGWEVNYPKATFYLWAKCPKGAASMDAAKRILAEANVVVIPGIGFGTCGEGFVRFALTVETPRIREAVSRLGRITW
ncbi:MAG: LL-diaminopimelate aminotransferase [Phycisphaerae bacterium]|nr:MAG: aminotransferase class I/II-fold pyridoxal phosphate-dependent enzyme [Planctomycetota bacterium]KAB2939254.1 MAG: aminotransferase class I/II-fold pyridoxal phosphate-dependent enzyme [Phycisphaerae bacterium]MBE7456209.1 LL-diaminopimelate aminotransferase [Planctomycetia bacterium]MCK6464758.1 LL-diaminopimelate aminotransferase [Phycisphaerae bacterium]MCL4719900.1 LL-diaminopimelate aminotransferase [Phycisphaerae bacterium]